MHCCQEMDFFLSEGKVAILYIPKFNEYGINLLNSSLEFQKIEFCPWCGKKLPKGLREEWFDIIDALGIEPDSPEIPEKYLSDEWWRSNTLVS